MNVAAAVPRGTALCIYCRNETNLAAPSHVGSVWVAESSHGHDGPGVGERGPGFLLRGRTSRIEGEANYSRFVSTIERSPIEVERRTR